MLYFYLKILLYLDVKSTDFRPIRLKEDIINSMPPTINFTIIVTL